MGTRHTSRRSFLRPKSWTSALGASAAFAVPEEKSPEPRLIRAGRPAMACQFEIFFPASQRAKIEAAHQALNEVQELERQMSAFQEDSEISRLNRTAHLHAVEVEERLFELLTLGLYLYQETGGAFDMTAGPLTRCWGFFRRQGRLPEPADIGKALEVVGSKHLRLDPCRRAVFFCGEGVEINLGSIGKGYALDRAEELLRKGGLSDALLHAGHSSIFASGNSPAQEGWKVSIRHPQDKRNNFAAIRLRHQGMATSGAGEQFFVWEGKKYGHVIDPRTGSPADSNLSATAIAKTAAEADALATAFFIMQLEEVKDYCRKHPGVGAVIVPRADGEEPLQCHHFGLAPEDLEVYL